MDEVKIIYCYDENKNPIHYSKTIKGNKYYCIDCGAELICKEGTKKIKHLAHKNSENCGGTGESIFHKHWKENLFKAGMFINIANRISDTENVEILDVLNEVSLNKRYSKNWDKEIIVDVLLVTEKGDVVVEINYKNSKNWEELKPYYKELPLVRAYEVSVDKNVNTKLEWFCLGEDEEIEKLQKQRQNEALIKEQEKQKKILEKKKERERLKVEKINEQLALKKQLFQNGTYKKCKVYFNAKTRGSKTNNTYLIEGLLEVQTNNFGQYKPIKLSFPLDKIYGSETRLINSFDVRYGIKYRYITINTTIQTNGYYEVIEVDSMHDENYDKRLYAKICQLTNNTTNQ